MNDPPVFNLVALNGPQAGVGECPSVEVPVLKQLCGDLGTKLDIYKWPFCSFCNYWKGKEKAAYLDKSDWLAEVNNDRTINPLYQANMRSLNKYMATRATEDTTVQPSYSAWHTYWDWGEESRKNIIPYNETDGYKTDALGLQTLDKRGDLLLNEFEGAHVSYNMTWWREVVLPMFGN